ncbi:MAG TPA: hypothetical protein VFE42_37210 [Chloroflexota bacterium]|nr:hypothetical protein [Chloroflexota bacterium]
MLLGSLRHRHAGIAFGLALFLLFGTAPRLPAVHAAPVPAGPEGEGVPSSYYAGWAMEAYPGDSVDHLQAEMQRQVAAGANVVWIGHDNPGDVGYDKHEPALSFAVWYAYRDPRAARHAEAVAMVQAQHNALEAARRLGVRVILPVGYQTQMGSAWNLAHPDAARRLANGAAYNGPNPIDIGASFYAPQYQHDIAAYYRWVDATFVRPYSGTIMMLNLADEPKDGDYSTWADRAFRAAHGYGLFDAGKDPVRQREVGRFEANYIADYAAWSAKQWLAIDPAMRVTMSFCGGYGRYLHEGPDLETIFSAAPSNFVVTFDAYPKDGVYDTPLRDPDLVELFNLVRTLGYYSAAYHRPLWLWSTANSWGLNAASSDPGNIADAVSNGIYLAQLARQAGGNLQGIAVWNYNIRGQGLYQDTHHLTYEPDQMFARVSASFPLLREIMSSPPGRPDTVVLAPNGAALRDAGARLALRARDQYHWESLAVMARGNVDAVTLTHLDAAGLPALRTAIVLARTPDDLAPADDGPLLDLLWHGGTVVAAGRVAHALVGQSAATGTIAATPGTVVRRIATAHGTLLAVDGMAVEELFADASARWALPVWRLALRRNAASTGYQVTAGDVTLFYTIALGGTTMAVTLPAGESTGRLDLYDTHGGLRQTLQLDGRHGPFHVFIARRTYALLS